MKNVLTVLLAVTAFSLLVLATKTYSGEPPDRIYTTCVIQSERTTFRMQRNMCDERATGLGYTVGIFRPDIENRDVSHDKCTVEATQYVCLGAPHQEETCPDGSLPPCEG